jgi:hypothetical protein
MKTIRNKIIFTINKINFKHLLEKVKLAIDIKKVGN